MTTKCAGSNPASATNQVSACSSTRTPGMGPEIPVRRRTGRPSFASDRGRVPPVGCIRAGSWQATGIPWSHRRPLTFALCPSQVTLRRNGQGACGITTSVYLRPLSRNGAPPVSWRAISPATAGPQSSDFGVARACGRDNPRSLAAHNVPGQTRASQPDVPGACRAHT